MVTRPAMHLAHDCGHCQVWQTRSQTNPAIMHITVFTAVGTQHCSCTGFQYNKKCWHTTVGAELRLSWADADKQ